MVAFSKLLAALADVPDPRRAQGKRYPLPYLLLFTVLALLSGAKSYRGIITFLEQRREHLDRRFEVDLKRAPAVNTLRTVLQSLPTDRGPRSSVPAPCQGPAARGRGGRMAGDRHRWQDAAGQLRPPQRPQGGPDLDGLRLGFGHRPGAHRERRQVKRDPRRPADDP